MASVHSSFYNRPMDDRTTAPAAHRSRGRGSGSNPETRFDRYTRTRDDDFWPTPDDLPLLRTEVRDEVPRSVITRNASPDIGFDRSINSYRGCEHGCVYCFARPTHAYLGLSPGLDFESRLVARPDGPRLLERELGRRTYAVAPIALGTNTDPYQPIEATRGITRGILDVLRAWRHPFSIATKGSLVERDADIIAEMAEQGLARVGVSVTTLDTDLARRLEPRVPPPARRLKTIERLARSGVEVRVVAAPMIPGLTDHELEAILTAARDAGAVVASWTMLRLPYEVAELFEDWLDRNAPDRKAKILTRLREMHGGKLYCADWGRRMRGEGLHARLLARRFEVAASRLGLDRKLPPLRRDLFARPLDTGAQMALF